MSNNSPDAPAAEPAATHLADVFAYATAEGITLRIDATEIRVRRPRQGRPGRKAFVAGKWKQNTIKTTIAADHNGAILWCGATRPGRMHDITTARVRRHRRATRREPTMDREMQARAVGKTS